MQKNKDIPKIEILLPSEVISKVLPYFEGGVSAGFPSPVDDFLENSISLDKELVNDKEATFYARVSGNSMIGTGMNDGDLLVIDKSIEAVNGSISVCFVDGDFTVKRIKKETIEKRFDAHFIEPLSF